MRPSSVSRSLLMAAAGSTILAGAAAAQSAPQAPAELGDIIVTGAPYGISQRA